MLADLGLTSRMNHHLTLSYSSQIHIIKTDSSIFRTVLLMYFHYFILLRLGWVSSGFTTGCNQIATSSQPSMLWSNPTTTATAPRIAIGRSLARPLPEQLTRFASS